MPRFFSNKNSCFTGMAWSVAEWGYKGAIGKKQLPNCSIVFSCS